MQALTIAILGFATAQASQIEDRLRSLSDSSSDLLGAVQDRCNDMVDVKCQEFDQSFNNYAVYNCGGSQWMTDQCLDTSKEFAWRELCDDESTNIGEEGWMYFYQDEFSAYHFYFVSQANYEEFLTSTDNDNCYWSGPMQDSGFYPAQGSIGEEQEQCYSGAIDVTFDFKCHDYDTWAAQEVDNGLYSSDYCLDTEGRVYWRDLTDEQQSELGEDGWALMVWSEGAYGYHMITESQYIEYLNSVDNDNCYWSGPLNDSWIYNNGGIGELEEKCTDTTLSREYNFACQKYANSMAQKCTGQSWYGDYCITTDFKMAWREMCDDEKEAFGNQDGWMFWSSSQYYFFVSKEEYESYIESHGDDNYHCKYSGPMIN